MMRIGLPSTLASRRAARLAAGRQDDTRSVKERHPRSLDFSKPFTLPARVPVRDRAATVPVEEIPEET